MKTPTHYYHSVWRKIEDKSIRHHKKTGTQIGGNMQAILAAVAAVVAEQTISIVPSVYKSPLPVFMYNNVSRYIFFNSPNIHV